MPTKHFDVIQIGAHTGDDEFAHEVRNAERALLIEPVPEIFEQLKHNVSGQPGVELENVAITDSNGTRDIFFIGDVDGLPSFASELGSFDKQHIFAVAGANGFLQQARERLEKISVNTATLQDVFARHNVGTIGHLIVDAEGEDLNILAAIDFDQIAVQRITFEYKHSDGFLTTGPKFARSVLRLQQNGFAVRRLDQANARATKIPVDNQGVLFVVWGDFRMNELESAVASVRQHNELPIGVIADQHSNELERLTDHLIVHDGMNRGLFSKDVMFDLSPFATTIFLDSDVTVLDSLEFPLERARKFGLAVAIAPAYSLTHYWTPVETDISEHAVIYNTGVIAFHKNETMKTIFHQWRACNERLACPCDQPGFAVAIEETGFNPFVLPRSWNFRPKGPHPLHVDGHGPIHIWHSREPVPSDLSFTQENAVWSYQGG